MPRGRAPWLARLLQPHRRQRQFGETEMKTLIAALLIVVASSQFACKSLVAGGVGAAVGVAAERERQEDKKEDEARARNSRNR